MMFSLLSLPGGEINVHRHLAADTAKFTCSLKSKYSVLITSTCSLRSCQVT